MDTWWDMNPQVSIETIQRNKQLGTSRQRYQDRQRFLGQLFITGVALSFATRSEMTLLQRVELVKDFFRHNPTSSSWPRTQIRLKIEATNLRA